MSARDEKLKKRMDRAGITREVTEVALDIDAILQLWRRRFTKRELGQHALTDLDLPFDLAELDVLMAVWAPSREFGKAGGDETMVSTVAARLAIDPSRASRLTSSLIKRGYLRRTVSQQDARRAVLGLTDAGARAVEAVRSYKFLVLGSFLKDWTPEEFETFLPLLERFSAWSERAASHSDPVAEEVAALRAALASDKPDA